MKAIKKIIVLLLMPFILASFFSCSSSKKLQNTLPFEIGKTYYQESNSGINIFIPVESNVNNILLDSVYFQGKKAKLEHENDLFVGLFKTNSIKKQDIIMSNEPHAEYGNKLSNLNVKSPFKLEANECIISYYEGDVLKYFKIKNVVRK